MSPIAIKRHPAAKRRNRIGRPGTTTRAPTARASKTRSPTGYAKLTATDIADPPIVSRIVLKASAAATAARAETGDGAIQPDRRLILSGVHADEVDQGEIRQRVKGDVEAVGKGRSAGRFDGPDDVAQGPRQQADPEGERRQASRSLKGDGGKTPEGQDDLKAVDDLAVDDWPHLSDGADEQGRRVGQQQDPCQGVCNESGSSQASRPVRNRG